MRHGVKLNRLSRTSSHRKALMSNLACELISHKRIVTTLAKARSLRVYVEPLLTKSKEDSTHQRRVIFSYLQDKEAVKEIFGVISPKIVHRPGGYTRIIKLGKRIGDNAESAMIELVDFNEIYGNKQSANKEISKKTTRRGSKKKVVETQPTEIAGVESAVQENKSTPTVEKESD